MRRIYSSFLLFVVALLIVAAKEFNSFSFYSKILDFTCTSSICESEVLSNSLLHIVVGTDHASSLPLLVFQVCEAIRRCIKKENMLFLLHAKTFEDKNENFLQISQFLIEQNISFHQWNDTKFTANSKMFASYDMLVPYNSNKKFIYQTDIDEMPVTSELFTALSEVEAGSCNAIRAKWTDRVQLQGKLIKPSIHTDMQSQFPLR